MYHQKAPLRFECTGCGQCCYGPASAYIHVSSHEIDRIREAMGLNEDAFCRDYLTRRLNGQWGIRLTRHGRCSLLGEDNRCRVYAVRPVQCQTYPFWPEILQSKQHWLAEQRRCEGINRGEAVPLTEIELNLQRAKDGENAL